MCVFLASVFCAALALQAHPPDQHNAPLVVQLKLDREVEPVLAAYIKEGLADAARRQASLVLITMDTPGGLSDSMTEIVHGILDSPVPVAVYVSPAGARGASAGFFILLSADVAAMAPGIYHMSKLLDLMQGKTRVTTILFYPGSIEGTTSLRFMNLEDRDALGNYRVKIYG